METTATREHPILFRPELVRKILDGKKTQTRRPVKWKKLPGDEDIRSWHQDGGGNWIGWSCTEKDDPELAYYTKQMYPTAEGFPCPFGQVGDVLWVRERWRLGGAFIDTKLSEFYDAAEVLWEHVHYAADDIQEHFEGQWRPSIHMPRWACRLRLEITDVRVERVQDISEADAVAEGMKRIELTSGIIPDMEPPFNRVHPMTSTYAEAFKQAWNAAYPGSWDRGDWVWVITFKKLESR